MKPSDTSTHWLDQAHNIKRLWRGFIAILILTLVAELLIEIHPHFEADSIFGFNAWFGFIGCAAMIAVAKALALLLKRPDTYYHHRDE